MSDGGERWRREPEASSASGGHLPSDLGTGPLFDALDAPLPSELERQKEREREHPRMSNPAPVAPASRTEVIPERPDAPRSPVQRKNTKTSRRKSRPPTRRVKRTIKHVDPLGILKVSLIMYTIFLGLWLVFVAIVYSFLDSLGLFIAIEDFGRESTIWTGAVVSLEVVEKYAFILGLVVMIVALLANVFISFLYNIIADLVGGVEVTFVERDAS
jgi:hypothetical protein